MTAISAVGHGVSRRGMRAGHVVLRVWGFAGADVLLAEQRARRAAEGLGWEVAEVLATFGTVCPIPSYDPLALKQGADYDWAWAAYRAGP